MAGIQIYNGRYTDIQLQINRFTYIIESSIFSIDYITHSLDS